MQRDLLDALRCPAPHDESWLVAMVHRADGPTLLEAELACPLCGAEYHVTRGEAWFSGTPDSVLPEASGNAKVGDSATDVERLAAQLGVMGGLAPVLLSGRYAAVATDYAALTGAPVVVIATERLPMTIRDARVSVLHIGHQVPLGAGTLAAAALDMGSAMANDASLLLASIARAVRTRGRMLAPISHRLPATLTGTMRELARDDDEWVAEVIAASSGLVELRRSPPPV
jgi:uncharacterized protein YbaR (Trm112 family)